MSCLDNLLVLVALLISAATSVSFESGGEPHECLRPCVDEPSSRRICRYDFYVSEVTAASSTCNKSDVKDEATGCQEAIPADGLLRINGRSPGPSIEVCLGDTIEIVVYNKLGTEELTLHWHGLRQKGSIHMDGVPMVTQCPILPFGGFRYKLKPETSGTYFYHAHSVSQQGDGVYGSLTVRGPRDDPTLERILLLSSRPPTPLTRHSHLYPPTPAGLLVNGQSDGATLKVSHGERYLLRVVNANAYNCPVLLSLAGHAFRVLATDGNLVESMTATRAVLFPGERLDLIVEANQPRGKYAIDMRGLQDCRDLRQVVFLLYDGIDEDQEATKTSVAPGVDEYAIANQGFDCDEISKDFVCALDLKASTKISTLDAADTTIYVPFDVNTFSFFTDEMSDNRYYVYGCEYYPAFLSRSEGEIKVAQISGVTFKYPSSPILSQPENTPEDSVCSLEQRSKQCSYTPLFCECIQIVEIPPKKNIEIILIDEGFGGNVSHTFHLHGYSASILGRGRFEESISEEKIKSLDSQGKLPRNLENPPQKDTFVVPNKGYVILRFYSDNLGYWLWEARSTAVSPGISGPGMQFLMRVGTRESLPTVPLDFPTCGNNKGPDMIFESN